MKKVTSDKLQATSDVFTCIGKGHGAPAVPATRKEWEELRKAPWLAEMCRRIEAGDEQLKHRLPVWTPMCAEFKDNHRAKADAMRPLPRLMLDFDEKGHSQEILKKALQLNEQGMWEILLVEESVRRGTHVLITLPEGMTPQEAQERFSKDVGFQADPSLKDVSRCIYMVTEGHTLWVSEKLFRGPHPGLPVDGDDEPHPGLPQGEGVDSFSGVQELQKFRSSDNSSDSDKQGETMQAEHSTPLPCGGAGGGSAIPAYHGLSSSEIVAKYWELTSDGQPPTQGDRNTKIFDLACSLRHIFGFDRELLNRAIPNYDGFPQEEKMQCIDNALREPRKYMPMKLTRVLQALKAEHSTPLPWEGQRGGSGASACPQIPKKLPPLIELLTRNVPEAMKAAVAHAVFPPLGAHLGGVKFRYIDNVEREATFMCVLLAKMSSGKSAVNKPIELIMKDIVERDALNRLREQEWKASLSTKGANKEKPKRPEGLCIQMLVPDMTNAAFVQRLADAQGKFLYTQMDELELLNNLKTSARGNQVSQIIRLAFDQGLYGQERVGAASVTAMVPIRWNWNASATIERGRQFFRTALTDGTLSRLNFCTIPPQRMGEIPVYGTYNAEYEAELKPYIDRLNAASGLVECAKAEALARALLKESAEVVMLTDDEVYEMLSHRANVIAYLKAMTLYIAHGYKWSKTIEEFVRWSKEYDLWCKMHFYGKRMQEEVEKEIIRTTPGRANMLEMLPDRFTRQQLEEVRVRLGKEKDATEQLSKWRQRGYVTLDGEESNLYVKSEKYKKRGGQWTMDN
ncbi:MAG: hypothetical protein IJX44_03680 [Bacteroidaceae bacterium]|nr:hypothetical protein [Bacteroidaceae bacterium]